jgi:hypothetical protein
MTTFQPPRKAGKKVPVAVARLEEWQRLVENLTRAIHSNAHMQKTDKVPVLGKLKQLREGLADVIQLKLFPDSSLDFDS